MKNVYRLNQVTELMNEFLNKCWTKLSINILLKKLWDTGTVNRLAGGGGPWRKCWPG